MAYGVPERLQMTDTGIAAVLNGFPEPVLILDDGLQIIAANRSAEILFGRELAGRRLISVVRWPEVLDCVETALREPGRAETSVRSRDQVQVTWHIVASPLDKTTETQPGVVLSLRDVSHVEEAERMRTDFVANVSHELRSPLTALAGFIETLKGSAAEDPVARERFLDIMEREAARMDRLIDDLLSLSRIEMNRHVRPTELIDVGDVAAEVIDALEPLATEHSIKLNFDRDPAPLQTQGDRDQLNQVLRNLIENAVKYGGDNQSVRVVIKLLDKAIGLRGPAIRIDVSDEGAGIPAEHIPRLTERFYRVDDARSRAQGGTGLGLAIVKHIVNRHRGRLTIESAQGGGSTFSVFLPQHVQVQS